MDADIILFEPNFDDYDYDEESYYKGKSLISKIDSFTLVKETTHWKKELSTILEQGKTVFVFFTAYKEFYIYSNEELEDKNIYDNYRFLPVQLPPIIPRAGKVIKPVSNPIFSSFWDNFKVHIKYESYIDGKIANPLFVTKTGEKPMYLNFFNQRKDITSVIHCHPPHSCAAAIMENPSFLIRPFYPETATEIGPVPVVSYAQPLTQELADNFLPYLQKYNSFIMENHGLVTMTTGDIKWTVMGIELFESSVQSMLAGLAVGKLKELDKKAVQNLGNVMRERDLPLFGAPGEYDSLEDIYF